MLLVLFFFCCRCCAAPPELPLRLPISLAINVERTAGPVLAIAVVAAGFQSLAALASPDLLDRSTTNEWRSSSPIPRHFCSSSPRNPYNIFSGSSKSCLAVGVAIYFFPCCPPSEIRRHHASHAKNSANPATASAATGKNIQRLPKKNRYPQA